MAISKLANFLVKGTGAAAIGLAAYDAHGVGMYQADAYATTRDAKNALYYLNNAMYVNNMSSVQDSIKRKAFNMELDQTWRRFFNTGIGYIKGFTSSLISSVVPLGLGIATLLTKGATSKFCAGALALYGGIKAITSFFGYGVPRGLDK